MTTNNWLWNQWDKRLSKTGLGLVTVEQVGLDQEGALTPGTHQYEEPGKHSRACKLADWRFWHCCPFDNLHRTGWMAAMAPASKARAVEAGKQKGRKEPQVSIVAHFSQLGAFFISLYLGQSKAKKEAQELS